LVEINKLDQYGLKGIFQKVGRVSDAFIPPRRTRMKRPRFGFVRFWRLEDALRSITRLHNAIIRGRRIVVSLAKYGKRKFQNINRSQQQRQEWKREEPWGGKAWKRKELRGGNKIPQTIVRFSQETQGFKQALNGEVNAEFEEWLSRSLVCMKEEPKDLATYHQLFFTVMGSVRRYVP